MGGESFALDGEVLVRRWSIGRSDDKRSLPDARAIADEFTARRVRLRLGGAVYDPTDPVGRLLFNMLAMVAEFEAHPIRLRTREGYEDREGQGSVAGGCGASSPSAILVRKLTWSPVSGPKGHLSESHAEYGIFPQAGSETAGV